MTLDQAYENAMLLPIRDLPKITIYLGEKELSVDVLEKEGSYPEREVKLVRSGTRDPIFLSVEEAISENWEIHLRGDDEDE